jgi:hypothetical protein
VAIVAALGLFLFLNRNERENAARELFSRNMSCPYDSVKAVLRKDLNAYDLDGPTPAPPPSDVAADPVRLAEWARRQKELVDQYNREAIVQASGCSREAYYVCTLGQGTQGQVMVCRSVLRPPGGK